MIPAPPASSRSSISTFAVVAPYFPRRRRALDDAAGAPLALPSGRTSRLARPFPAMDLESREELLERLFDVGVASDDVTVADVTSRADPARFNAVASRLAADVAALAPAAGADDQRGVTAAAAAVYRAVAGAGANPAASSSRAEQALRRLAAAIDATAPSNRCGTPELLASLVTYAQAATMIARRAKATSETTAEPRAAIPAPDDDREGEGGPLGGPPGGAVPMDHSSAASPSPSTKNGKSKSSPSDAHANANANAKRARPLRRVVGALAGDDRVATAAKTRAGVPVSAPEVLAACVAATRRAMAALPPDHRARLFPPGAEAALAPNERATLRDVAAALDSEYRTRKETVARRAGLTARAFAQSARLEDQPDVCEAFRRRAEVREDAGGRGDDSGSVRDSDSDLPYRVNVGLADVWDARVGDLARVDQRTNAEQARALEASAKRVRIGAVPDRGGRATRSGDKEREKVAMPAFAPRTSAAGAGNGDASRAGKEKGGRGGRRGGGRGRGGGGGRGNKW